MFAPHTADERFRARVEDREGDRWAVIGSLSFLSMHCADHRLRIIWIKPMAVEEGPTDAQEAKIRSLGGIFEFARAPETQADGTVTLVYIASDNAGQIVRVPYTINRDGTGKAGRFQRGW
jgi:hypothetical protein